MESYADYLSRRRLGRLDGGVHPGYVGSPAYIVLPPANHPPVPEVRFAGPQFIAMLRENGDGAFARFAPGLGFVTQELLSILGIPISMAKYDVIDLMKQIHDHQDFKLHFPGSFRHRPDSGW